MDTGGVGKVYQDGEVIVRQGEVGNCMYVIQSGKAKVVEEFERAYIVGVMEAHGGKLSAAAKHADMDPKNLWEKLTKYGLRRLPHAPEPRAADEPGGGRRARP